MAVPAVSPGHSCGPGCNGDGRLPGAAEAEQGAPAPTFIILTHCAQRVDSRVAARAVVIAKIVTIPRPVGRRWAAIPTCCAHPCGGDGGNSNYGGGVAAAAILACRAIQFGGKADAAVSAAAARVGRR